MSECRPNLFIIGAMRSGTTSLHTYLSTHPQVFMSSPKEPSHFVERRQLRAEWPEMERCGYWDRDAYLRLFTEAGDAKVVSEASTNYSKLPRITGVVERIAEFNPDARILYLMRDPIERTLSHYWHFVLMQNERRPPLEAIREEPHYRQVSHYAFQLAAYFERFPRAAIFTVTTEVLLERPVKTMQEIFRWLGVDDDHVPPNLAERRNATKREVPQVRGRGWLRRLRRSSGWQVISPWVPALLRRLARRASERPIDVSSVPTDDAVEYLKPRQRAETAELSELLGRTFPEWTNLHAD